jgi:hypothetical protein
MEELLDECRQAAVSHLLERIYKLCLIIGISPDKINSDGFLDPSVYQILEKKDFVVLLDKNLIFYRKAIQQ